MRLGILSTTDHEQLDLARSLGFTSFEWVRFHQTSVATADDWQPLADEIAARAEEHGLRLSAIAALYQNPLHPDQRDYAEQVFRRAIDVAARINVRTVAGFPGAVIQTRIHERGGNPVYEPLENFLPQLLEFWEPLARIAEDQGVRIAFEHCPQGPYHLPIMHYNSFGQPALWERLFNATACENIGIEWDPSHLVCQFIDPITNIEQFGSRIFHVHAKDAYINSDLLRRYGICHEGVAEHRFPGLGQSNWAEIIHALLKTGYDSDINIEGWHDPVYRDHPPDSRSPLAGQNLETTGLLIAKKTLESYLPALK